MIQPKVLYLELSLINQLIFKPCGIVLENVNAEPESREYFAHTFELNGRKARFRTAKITPTKTGQFVTIWKRNEKGITVPFSVSDANDFYIIATRKENHFGIFIFPKTVLHQNKILSDKAKDGKRGIRVYPIWDVTTNKQAQRTQLWQKDYFLEVALDGRADLERAKVLLYVNDEQ